MNKVVDLATTVKQEKEFNLFIEESVELNKDLVAAAIVNMKNEFSTEFIIDTYASQLLAHGLQQFDKEKLISSIANGSIFEAKSVMINSLIADPVISSVL